jgi:hypothetical protein
VDLATIAMFSLLASPVVLVFYWMYYKRSLPRKLEKKYISALEQLRRSPRDIGVRMAAQQEGRAYYSQLEKDKVPADAIFLAGSSLSGRGIVGYAAAKSAEVLAEQNSADAIDARIRSDIESVTR